MLNKICSKCKQSLPLDKFSRHSGRPYPRSECKNCNNAMSKLRKNLRKEHKEPDLTYNCPICQRSGQECNGEGGKSSGPWVVDHCHTTKKFRGWLCHKCNRALGHLNDSTILLHRALDYLNGLQ
jgi:hypothetical protein